MKTLVVYYSRDGHTKIVAKEMAAALAADIEEIRELKSRKGIFGWLLAGHDASRKKPTEIATFNTDPNGYDLVIIGTPVWAFTMTPAIRTWLTKYGKNLKNVAFFATMGGSGDKRTFTKMEELCGRLPIITGSFIDKKVVHGEHKAKLDEFLQKLQEKCR